MDIDIILEPDVSPDQIKELGLLAESYDIRCLWIQNYASGRDAFMSMVPLAMASRNIQLGVMVVSPWEMHPLKMANSLLTLNEYSGGRACMTVGGGGEWCGIMGVEPARRVRAVRETIEILKAACGNRKLPDYQGEMYKARGFKAPWATDKPPLVYSGAGKEQMIRMSTRKADGIVLSDAVPSFAATAMEMVRETLPSRDTSAGEFRTSNFWAWHVKAGRDAAFREARRELIIRSWLETAHISSFMSEEDCKFIEANKWAFINAYRDRSGDIKDVPERIVNELIEGITSTGDLTELDQHIERLRAFKEAGLDELALRVHDDPAEAIHIIGKEVAPALR